MSKIFISFFIIHIIGDFYFQSNNVAEKKKDSYITVCIHSIIYIVPFFLLLLFDCQGPVVFYALSSFISHFIIDSFKYTALKAKKLDKYRCKNQIIFLTDQLLHLTANIIICTLYLDKFSDISLLPSLSNLISYTPYSQKNILKFILYILLVLRPANISFKVLFENISPYEDSISNGYENTGAIIGCMERILIIGFLLVDQFTAIGLVITGKSLARYKNIAENKEFAEYYLVGTFYSILWVITLYLLLFKLL